MRCWKFKRQIGRDVTFVLQDKNLDMCLFSFDEDGKSRKRICILCKDGSLFWTSFRSPKVPEKAKATNEKELYEIGESWLKNYNGTY
jgi:hypothetical protein